MFELCLFDLDDTLVRTEDLKIQREACKNTRHPALLNAVRAALDKDDDRHLVSSELLEKIRQDFPGLKLGVFTRSPRSYTETVLRWAYPGFKWDVIVAFEDVSSTKPNGEGIQVAMTYLGVKDLESVVMVGDSDVDIRAAYHGGCSVALVKTTWPNKWLTDHWNAAKHIPDAIIDTPEDLLAVLNEPDAFLPELERLYAGAARRPTGARFERFMHFVPNDVEPNVSHHIFLCGRSFANKPSLKSRRNRHDLTQAIEAHKDAEAFPDEWIKAIRQFILKSCRKNFSSAKREKVVVTVVPHRPGRKPRLELMLEQLRASVDARPIAGCCVSISDDLLAYQNGVRSQHRDLLNQHERFVNVRDHLYVKKPARIDPAVTYVVIDDVCTTGASLIYAAKYLMDAGADEVKCLALAKNIGEVLA